MLSQPSRWGRTAPISLTCRNLALQGACGVYRTISGAGPCLRQTSPAARLSKPAPPLNHRGGGRRSHPSCEGRCQLLHLVELSLGALRASAVARVYPSNGGYPQAQRPRAYRRVSSVVERCASPTRPFRILLWNLLTTRCPLPRASHRRLTPPTAQEGEEVTAPSHETPPWGVRVRERLVLVSRRRCSDSSPRLALERMGKFSVRLTS